MHPVSHTFQDKSYTITGKEKHAYLPFGILTGKKLCSSMEAGNKAAKPMLKCS